MYELDSTGTLRCPAHGHAVSAMEPCPDCTTAPESDASKPAFGAAQADQSLARTVRDEILELARQYKDQRDESESRDRIGFSTVAKLYDTALKWHRAATEERKTDDDRAFAEWLVEEKRRLLGRGRVQ